METQRKLIEHRQQKRNLKEKIKPQGKEKKLINRIKMLKRNKENA